MNGHLVLALPPLSDLTRGGKLAYASDDARLMESLTGRNPGLRLAFIQERVRFVADAEVYAGCIEA